MQGMKAKELQTLWSRGKHMPTRKLPIHENRLPIDMAIGRGESSRSSVFIRKKKIQIYIVIGS